jgi:hypothetical protein
MKRAIAATVLFCLVAVPAFSSNWVYLTTENNCAWYIYSDTKLDRVWTKTVCSVGTVVQLFEADCTNKRLRKLATYPEATLFDDDTPGPWKYPPPETIAETLMNRLCE